VLWETGSPASQNTHSSQSGHLTSLNTQTSDPQNAVHSALTRLENNNKGCCLLISASNQHNVFQSPSSSHSTPRTAPWLKLPKASLVSIYWVSVILLRGGSCEERKGFKKPGSVLPPDFKDKSFLCYFVLQPVLSSHNKLTENLDNVKLFDFDYMKFSSHQFS